MEQRQYKDNMGFASRLVKRLFDIVVALLLLLLTSPLTLVIFILLRCEVDHSAFYSQERIGRGGRIFRIRKFRTMHNDSEEDGVPLLATDDDSRLTPIGRFLRAHHLDELPQLWNVLTGDMSFVGYRPERQYFVDQITALNPDYTALYKIQPGVTSPATLYNGYTDTMPKMLRRLDMDLEYLTTRTLFLDLKIIFLTALYTLLGKRF